MAEYEKSLDGLRKLLKEIETAYNSSEQFFLEENFSACAQDTLEAYEEKKDFDSAMDCVELVLKALKRGRDDEVQLVLVNNMKVALHKNKLYSGSDSSPVFTRAFGELGKQLEHVEALGQKIVTGPAGGIAGKLAGVAVLAALVLALWFFPPLVERLGYVTAWIYLGLTLAASAGAALLASRHKLMAALITFLVFFIANTIYEAAVPDGWENPVTVSIVRTAVTVIAVLWGYAVLNKPVRRHHYVRTHREEIRRHREHFRAERDALCRRCDDMGAVIAYLRKELNDEKRLFLSLFVLVTRGDEAAKDEKLMDQEKKRMNDSLNVMGKYYEYIKNRAIISEPMG